MKFLSKICTIFKSFLNSGQHLSHVRKEVVTSISSRPILSDSQWKAKFYPTADIPESFITWFRQSISNCWGFDLSQAVPTDRLAEDLGLGTATWNDTYLDIVEDLMDTYKVSMPESRELLDKSITTLDDMSIFSGSIPQEHLAKKSLNMCAPTPQYLPSQCKQTLGRK